MIYIEKGDITTYDVDAIVNAANCALSGGGGVDGAIHRAAGKELMEECRKLKRCPTGTAVMTKGYLLKAKYVIHTAGPVWRGGTANEEELLKSCYTQCMKIAKGNNFSSIAFPSISTGAYRFPLDKACIIAMNTIKEEMLTPESLKDVYIVCFDDKTLKAYEKQI